MNTKLPLKIIMPIMVMALILVLYAFMQAKRPKAAVQASRLTLPQVSATPLTAQSRQVVLTSQGHLEAAYRSSLVAELGARVTWVSPQFEPGERVRQGAPLVRFDARDANAEWKMAKAALISAEVALKTEKTRADLAKAEWQLLQPNGDKPPSTLTLREPQLAAAEANVLAQQGRLERAEMLLERSTLIAPYDGYVIERKVSPGQTVNAGTIVGEIVGAESLRLRLPLTQEDVGKLRSLKTIPVKIEINGEVWETVVSRMASEADRQTAKVDAFVDINTRAAPIKSLKPGVFLRAQIFGPSFAQVFTIPRITLDNDGRAPFIDNGVVRWRPLQAVANDGSSLWVTEGVKEGDLLIVSNVTHLPNGSRVERMNASTNSQSTPSQTTPSMVSRPVTQ